MKKHQNVREISEVVNWKRQEEKKAELLFISDAKACGKQRPTAVELQLVVEVVQLLLDVRGTRAVITGAERQQHVDLQFDKQRNSAAF